MKALEESDGVVDDEDRATTPRPVKIARSKVLSPRS